jgi:hypothetical protein
MVAYRLAFLVADLARGFTLGGPVLTFLSGLTWRDLHWRRSPALVSCCLAALLRDCTPQDGYIGAVKRLGLKSFRRGSLCVHTELQCLFRIFFDGPWTEELNDFA